MLNQNKHELINVPPSPLSVLMVPEYETCRF